LAGGFRAIFRDEGWAGLYRGTLLALVGVGNGALQFMAYEKMKNWAFERKQRRVAKLGRAWTTDDDKLVRFSLSSIPHTNFLLTIVGPPSVEYGVYHHVRRVETRRARRDLSIPSHPLPHPSKQQRPLRFPRFCH